MGRWMKLKLTDLTAEALRLGICLDSVQLTMLDRYTTLLMKANESFNLTAISDRGEILRKHVLDSLFAVKHIEAGASSLVDVGTGAGLPGIPLTVAIPHLSTTLLDSTEKKVRFLGESIVQMGLDTRARAVVGRAEVLGRSREHRECYDVAISRAVARLNVLAEFCLPFVRVGGTFLALKGPAVTEELAEANHALKALGGDIASVAEWTLPGGGEIRSIVTVRKIRPTPDVYPRRIGLPAKKPL